jgi:hypothetical protein
MKFPPGAGRPLHRNLTFISKLTSALFHCLLLGVRDCNFKVQDLGRAHTHPRFFAPSVLILAATLAWPLSLGAQSVSVTAPENGDRIVPGTDFVISASATGDATVGPVTGVEFFVVPNKGAAGPVALPGADALLIPGPLGDRITFAQITNAGSGYVTEPVVTISDGVVTFSTTAQLDADGKVISIRLNRPGNSGFDSTTSIAVVIDPPPVVPGRPAGVQATAVAGFSIGVSDIGLAALGYDVFFPPVVTVSPPQLPGGTSAVARPVIVGGVLDLAIDNPGSGYTSPPTITIASPRAAFSVGTVPLYPFVQAAQLPSNDRYTLYAVASYLTGIDIESGGGITGPVVIGEQGVVPTVEIIAPTATTGFLAGQSILVQATAEFDPPTPAEGDAVASFELFVNGISAGTSPTPVFDYVPATAGFYALVVRATTIRGLVADSLPLILTVTQGTPPEIKIEQPVESPDPGDPLPAAYEMRLNETVTIRASVTVPENGTNVESVEFLLNGRIVSSLTGSQAYNFSWTADNAGRYLVSARVIDNLGNVVETGQILINVTQGVAPEVELTEPTDGSNVTLGVPVVVSADVEGKSGTVTQVEFVVNGVVVGSVAGDPFVAFFTPTALGPYEIFARATDSLGNVTDSAKRTVTAVTPSPNAPVVSLSRPPGQVFLVGGSELYFNATASNADGSPLSGAGSGVTFLVNGLPVPATEQLGETGYAATYTIGNAPAIYVVQAVATDGSGNKAASNPSTVLTALRQNDLPQVRMLELLPGTPVFAGGTVNLRAEAFFPALASGGSVVEFYANGVYLGDANSAGNIYSLAWNVPADLAGTTGIEITARAVAINTSTGFAFLGSSLSKNLTAPLNLAAGAVPVVNITVPTLPATSPVNFAREIRAVAQVADSTIDQVDFYANGRLIGTDNVFPYTVTWTPTATGVYEIGAIATAASGLQGLSPLGTITVPLVIGPTPDMVEITAPVPVAPATTVNLNVNQTTTFRAEAEAAAGRNIARVDFLFNDFVVQSLTAAPYQFEWTATNAGQYIVVAYAYDDLGNLLSSDPLVVNVAQGTPPTVSIASPADGGTITPGIPVTIIADVEGQSGSITQVDFFVNSVNVGSTTTEPFLAGFTPSAAGPYTIFARATDSLGNVKDSAAVTVNAVAPSGAQPLVSLTQPTGGTQLVGGSKLYLNATATKSDGTIDTGMSVTFLVNGVPVTGTPDQLKPAAFSATFDVARAPFSYVVQAVATQTGGLQGASSTLNITSAVAQNQLPQVQMLDLLPGTDPASKGGVVPLRARAIFPATAATNARVEFYANGVYLGEQATAVNGVFTLNWTVPSTLTDPAVRITARAIAQNFGGGGGGGGGGAAATVFNGSVLSTNVITLNLQAGEVPVPSVTFPSTTGTIPVGIATEIRATVANLASGSIANVDFYANGVLVGSDATAPYAVAWTPTSAGIYSLAAIATSTAGLEGASVSGYNVSVTSGAAPTVSLTSPATSPASAAVNSPVVLAANATDSDGSVVSVTFLANGVPLPSGEGGENPGLVAPYRYNFTPTSPGRYEIVARATDNLGNITDSAPITLTAVVGTPPTVSIIMPTNGVRIIQGVPAAIMANVAGGTGSITQVDFLVNDSIVGSLTSAPFVTSFVPQADGPYTIFVRAVDSLGNVTDSSNVTVEAVPPSNLYPSIAMTLPQVGVEFAAGSRVYLNLNVTDPLGAGEVKVYVNGVELPVQRIGSSSTIWSALWQPQSVGNYTIFAVVSDSSGNTASSVPTTFRVVNRQANLPVIAIDNYQLTSGYLEVGVPVILRARANFGTNTSPAVEFYANGVFLGTATAGPVVNGVTAYSLEWIPEEAGTNITLTARAVGVNGAAQGGGGGNQQVIASVINSNTPSFPVTGLTIHEVPSSGLTANGQFVVDVYNKLLYSQPFYSEWKPSVDWLNTQGVPAPTEAKAEVIMQLMGFRAGLFNPTVEYAMTSGVAFSPFARLGLVPTQNGVTSFLQALENSQAQTLLPLSGSYLGINGAPFGATDALATALQTFAFNTPEFQSSYLLDSRMTNVDFVNKFLLPIMFANRNVAPTKTAVDSIVEMMEDYNQVAKWGASAAFATKYTLNLMALQSPLAAEALAGQAAERAFQLKLNSAALNFQWNSGDTSMFGAGFSTAPDYSKNTVCQIIDPAYAPPLLAQTVTLGVPDIIEFKKGQRITLSAAASSGQPATFTSSNSRVLSISGRTATVLATGSVGITASVVGNGSYLAGSNTKLVQIVPPRRTQSITGFGPKPNVTFNSRSFTLSARASSGLPVSYTSSNPSIVSVVGNRATIHQRGNVTITASQAGNTRFRPAAAVRRNVRIW